MSILHYSDRQKGVVFVVWDGQVTRAHWREHVQRLLADPDWPMISRLGMRKRNLTEP
jgi:hypothetical protein